MVRKKIKTNKFIIKIEYFILREYYMQNKYALVFKNYDKILYLL